LGIVAYIVAYVVVNKPANVSYFLPFLKIKEKNTTKISEIRKIAFENKVESQLKLLDGRQVRESMREPYTQVLALVQKKKRLITKDLGFLFRIPPSKTASWLEQLRALNLLMREKRQGPPYGWSGTTP
jgi:hypothetical protein